MKTIGIIGGGNMGAAIIKGIAKKFKVAVCEADKKKAACLKKTYKSAILDLSALMKQSDIVIIAVKPQDIDPVLDQMAQGLRAKQLIVSIAAGITTSYIEKKLGGKPKVIRTMPNLPALIGQGVTAIAKGRYALAADVRAAVNIFKGVGSTVIVKESQIDAVTAVSGSGPAYVFLFAESLIRSARKLGLDEKTSKELVLQTLSGSADLLKDSKESTDKLRKRVTSKGGTTQAAVEVMIKRHLPKIYEQALKAAKTRAKQLSRKV